MHQLLRQPSADFTRHMRELAITEIPEVDNDPDIGVTWSFPKNGIEVHIQNDRVATVFLFGEANASYAVFEHSPYEAVGWDTSFEDLQTQLGAPSLFSDGNPNSEFGPIPPWIRYDREKYSVHFEFAADKLRIRKVTYMSEAPGGG